MAHGSLKNSGKRKIKCHMVKSFTHSLSRSQKDEGYVCKGANTGFSDRTSQWDQKLRTGMKENTEAEVTVIPWPEVID